MSVLFSDIVKVRLAIFDPRTFINIVEIDLLANLPTAPAKKTAYFVTETTRYMYTEILTGALPSDYAECDLKLPDSVISAWIESLGVFGAIDQALRRIVLYIGSEIKLSRMSNGQDAYQFTTLKETLDFYMSLIELNKQAASELENNSTGRIGASKKVPILGGMCI